MATSLIDQLNSHIDKTPDQIVAAIGDPLSQWNSLTTFFDTHNYDQFSDRDIVLFKLDEGMYTHNQFAMTQPYSYRTLDPAHAQTENMEGYDPSTARGCGEWWFIGAEYLLTTPLPTTRGDPSQEEEDEDYEEEPDPDFD